jgi:hypothetical protein
MRKKGEEKRKAREKRRNERAAQMKTRSGHQRHHKQAGKFDAVNGGGMKHVLNSVHDHF